MLIPNKHANPELTVLAVSAYILQRLKRTRIKTFEELREIIRNNNSMAEPLFLQSIQFLYLLGLIDYHSKNDTIEYIEQHEAK